MKSNLQFDFIVDKENNTITVEREFAAGQQLVWDAYTKSELLEQWFAPRPWKAKTGNMDFCEGGHWLYAMCGPNGEEHWGRMNYITINPIDSYTGHDIFCDAQGNINEDLPQGDWQVTFKPYEEEHTMVKIVITYASLSDMEAIIKMGMKEGLTMTLEHLDELLVMLTNK